MLRARRLLQGREQLEPIDRRHDDEVFRSLQRHRRDRSLRDTLRYPLTADADPRGRRRGRLQLSRRHHAASSMNGVADPLPDANAHVDEKRGEVFGQGTWKILPELDARGRRALRVSRPSARPATRQADALVLLSQAARRADLVAGQGRRRCALRYEKVVGQLDFGNFIATGNLGGSGVTAGNSDLRPDQRTQYELSYRASLLGQGRDRRCSCMHEEITDVVDFVPGHGARRHSFDAPGNIGNGHEQPDQRRFRRCRSTSSASTNGLLHTTTNLPAELGARSGDGHEPRHLRRAAAGHRGLAHAGHRQPEIDLGIGYYNCWDEHYFRLDQTQHRRVIPPYISAYWEYKPTPDWSLHFELDNLGRFVYDEQVLQLRRHRARRPARHRRPRDQSQPRMFFEIRKTFN